MKVHIPSQLLSYTRASTLMIDGQTLGEVLLELERRFPGVRFRIIDEQDRIRQHIHIFINQEMAEGLDHSLNPTDDIRIIGALSGG